MAGSPMLHEPPADLLDHVRNNPDPELGDRENVCSPGNRQLRLFVAAWMLPRTREGRFDVRGALALYEGCGRDLLEQPGRLTVSGIYAEVLAMLDSDGRPA